jgi:hypothetical protein
MNNDDTSKISNPPPRPSETEPWPPELPWDPFDELRRWVMHAHMSAQWTFFCPTCDTSDAECTASVRATGRACCDECWYNQPS